MRWVIRVNKELDDTGYCKNWYIIGYYKKVLFWRKFVVVFQTTNFLIAIRYCDGLNNAMLNNQEV